MSEMDRPVIARVGDRGLNQPPEPLDIRGPGAVLRGKGET
jgi:hypothetical protein